AVGENAAEQYAERAARACQPDHQTRERGGEAAASREIEREKDDHERPESIDQRAPPQHPELAGQAASSVGEPAPRRLASGQSPGHCLTVSGWSDRFQGNMRTS